VKGRGEEKSGTNGGKGKNCEKSRNPPITNKVAKKLSRQPSPVKKKQNRKSQTKLETGISPETTWRKQSNDSALCSGMKNGSEQVKKKLKAK